MKRGYHSYHAKYRSRRRTPDLGYLDKTNGDAEHLWLQKAIGIIMQTDLSET